MTDFRIPAEWEHHRRTWMVWPCRKDIWNAQLGEAKQCFKKVAETILQYEPLTLVVCPEQRSEVDAFAGQVSGALNIIEVPTDNSWARDVFPLFMMNSQGRLQAKNWDFNGWGQKYSNYENDRQFGRHLMSHLSDLGELESAIEVDWVLEGGSVHLDGEGTLLTTRQCLLHEKRNPGYSQEEMALKLKSELNVEKVVWLENGLWGDFDTDGHVNMMAAFAAPGIVLMMSSEDENHPNYEIYQLNKAILAAQRDAKGRAFKVIEVPQPMTVLWEDRPLPLSYINFYIVNGAVIVPIFDDPHDAVALSIFAEAFPDRVIEPLEVLPIFRGGAGIHRITMQQPGPIGSEL